MTSDRRGLCRRHLLGVAAAALAAPTLILSPARAQMGDKVVRFVSGFPAGAGSDPIARALAEKLRGTYAANVIVENKPGAAGRLAPEFIKNAAADGTSILFTPAGPMTVFPHIYKKLSYDPLKDFAPVTTLMSSKLGLIAGPGTPAKTMAEYLVWIKANQKNASYGSMGAGTMPHFLGAMFGREVGVDLTHVAYKGAAPVWQDLLGGQLPVAFSPIGYDSVTRHKAGTARILAIADPVRTKQLPDVPTFAELGYKSLQLQEWFGLFVPAKTPPEVIAALNRAVQAALVSPEVSALIERNQSEPSGCTPAELAARMTADTELWAKIVKSTGFTPED